MPLIGVLLTRYWKPLALAVLIAAAFAYRAILIHERDRARAQLAELTAEAAALRASNQALGSAGGASSGRAPRPKRFSAIAAALSLGDVTMRIPSSVAYLL